jgi:hypothetical protein
VNSICKCNRVLFEEYLIRYLEAQRLAVVQPIVLAARESFQKGRIDMSVKGLMVGMALTLLIGWTPRPLALSGTLKIDNKSSSAVTVNIDGNYCCRASSGGICTCQVSAGSHKIRSTRSDNDKSFEDTFEIGEGDTYTYTLTDS